jgi:hypothetical protein
MEAKNVELVSRVIGSVGEVFKINPVWVEIVQEEISVKDLLAQAVEAQINELLTNQNLDQQQAGKILDQYYPEQDSMEDPREDTRSSRERRVSAGRDPISITTETKRAFQAFRNGAVAVFVDGVQMQDLKQRVTITSETKIKFIRFMPLKGG